MQFVLSMPLYDRGSYQDEDGLAIRFDMDNFAQAAQKILHAAGLDVAFDDKKVFFPEMKKKVAVSFFIVLCEVLMRFAKSPRTTNSTVINNFYNTISCFFCHILASSPSTLS